MWDDLLLAVGEFVLDILPIAPEHEDFFMADVMEIEESTRFPGRAHYRVRLRPLTRQPEGWFACKRKHLPLLQPGRRVFAAVRKGKNKLVRVSALQNTVNKSEKEIRP